MLDKKFITFPTQKAANIFRDSKPSRELLRRIVESSMDQDKKVSALRRYVELSVTRSGVFYRSIHMSEIDYISFYEIIRRYKDICEYSQES